MAMSLKPMSSPGSLKDGLAQRIRDLLAKAGTSMSIAEIARALRETESRVRSAVCQIVCRQAGMVSEGKHPKRYTLLGKPAPKAESPNVAGPITIGRRMMSRW
jgi:hypothetical protein